jgi:carbon storage regulator
MEGPKMLVLSRKIGERIVIQDNITVEVLQIIGNRVRLGVTAPSGIPILREELLADAPKVVEKKDIALEGATR